jgi:hypothetical protein
MREGDVVVGILASFSRAGDNKKARNPTTTLR